MPININADNRTYTLKREQLRRQSLLWYMLIFLFDSSFGLTGRRSRVLIVGWKTRKVSSAVDTIDLMPVIGDFVPAYTISI
jgi:hypothetical protein